MSEERLARIEHRLDEVRDLISEEVSELYARIEAEVKPRRRWYEVYRRVILWTWIWALVIATGILAARELLPPYFVTGLFDLAGNTLKTEMAK
uniref:Uncharacterized protein n=1 Tax=viral metagenome TaxID=1070528 RepID=A0A6M3IDE1_9ZZZZ